ncbi:MAG TPA: FG-GAP-like repeat-containing protein, partial [Promineifilum sp.]
KCQGLLVGDADGNGLDDLICPYNYGGDQTRTFVQFAFETFMTQWISHHPLIQPQFNVASCRTLQAGDINGDGRVDLLCPYDYGNGATTTFVQYLNGAIHTSWQQASNLIPAGNFDMNRCRPLMAGDVNGDGRVDLICPYDYGDASTATFVQLSQDFRILLPGIFREE